MRNTIVAFIFLVILMFIAGLHIIRPSSSFVEEFQFIQCLLLCMIYGDMGSEK